MLLAVNSSFTFTGNSISFGMSNDMLSTNSLPFPSSVNSFSVIGVSPRVIFRSYLVSLFSKHCTP